MRRAAKNISSLRLCVRATVREMCTAPADSRHTHTHVHTHAHTHAHTGRKGRIPGLINSISGRRFGQPCAFFFLVSSPPPLPLLLFRLARAAPVTSRLSSNPRDATSRWIWLGSVAKPISAGGGGGGARGEETGERFFLLVARPPLLAPLALACACAAAAATHPRRPLLDVCCAQCPSPV